MIVLLPLLIAILGALVYAISNNAKVAELGRLMFAVGLLVTLWNANHVVSLFHG